MLNTLVQFTNSAHSGELIHANMFRENVLLEWRPLTSPVVTHVPVDGRLCCLMHHLSNVTSQGTSSDQEERT